MNDDPKGALARLPNNDLVRIETIENGKAQVRRIEGDRKGTLAVCDLDKLLIEDVADR